MINLDKIHFVTIIEEGLINMYDENDPVFQEVTLFCKIECVLGLFPKFLKQRDMFDYLLDKLLNEQWDFSGRKLNLPQN